MMHSYYTAATPTIRVGAEEGPITIPFSAVAAYHGHGAMAMLAIIFQGLRGALPLLEKDGQAVPRRELSIICGHPGPGVRDAIEFITRAKTREAFTLDTSLPLSRLSPAGNIAYAFILQRGEQQVTAALKEGVLPKRFFELFGQTEPAAIAEHAQLRHHIAATVLAQAPEEIFDFTLATR
jgi:hypothetical protein